LNHDGVRDHSVVAIFSYDDISSGGVKADTSSYAYASKFDTVYSWEIFPSAEYDTDLGDAVDAAAVAYGATTSATKKSAAKWGVSAGEAHFYTECSNKGLCDRDSGECVCFEGYTGSSCQRTTCPNDCSGHGVCRTVQEIAEKGYNYRRTDNHGGDVEWEGVTPASSGTNNYRLWDMDKAQSCWCDPGYSGPDCSRRECPRGDDPLTHRKKECGGSDCVKEIQKVTMTAGTGTYADVFVIKYKDWTGKQWVTDKFAIGTGSGADCQGNTATQRETIIANALKGIPNGVIEDIKVTITATSTTVNTYTIEFTDNSGNVDALEFVNTDAMNLEWGAALLGSCASAARTAKDITVTYPTTGAVTGNEEESTCSNRGVCDYETGICKCFKGYYNDDCSTQNALAQ